MIENEAMLYTSANCLIEDIFEFRKLKCEDLTLMETMIEYSFQKDIPIQELGNRLADHKDFVEVFRKQLVKESYFREEHDAFDEIQMEDEEW